MERINDSITKHYWPLKVFLDDLEKIEQLLKSSCSEVYFETEGFRFTSIEELLANVKKTRLKTLYIRTNSPYLTLSLEKVYARLYLDVSKNRDAGIVYYLDRIILVRNRWLKWMYSYLFIFTANGFLASDTIFKFNVNRYLYDSISAIFFMWTIWVLFIRMYHYSTIILKRHEEQGSFIERNKDDILNKAIAAIFGALVWVGGTMLVTYLTKK